MNRTFDVVVIGTGSAAATVAGRCRAAGRQVAIIDSRPFGGTCALRGCDPKKVLVGAAEAIDWSRRMQGKGILAGEARLAWRELMRFKRSFTEPVPKAREEAFLKNGIVTVHGRARFTGANTVKVGDDVLEGRNVVVASGARPQDLKIPGAELVALSDRFLDLEELPARIVFIGGGYISMEFAHVAARAGSRVTILHRGERPLERFDPELVDQLVRKSREIGIDLQLKYRVTAIDKDGHGLRVRASSNGAEQHFQADLVVHGAGRVPEIDDMDLDKAGVEWDPRRGVKVNEFLQSVSNPAVYAAGDAAGSGGPPLTPVAGHEGQVVSDNLLQGNHRKPDYRGVASVAFTIPPLASVGLLEQEAREKNLRFRTNHGDTSRWYSSRRVAEDCAGFKMLIEEGTDRILGAHLLGPHAEDTINLFALAIRKELTAADLKGVIFAYPTHGSDVQYML